MTFEQWWHEIGSGLLPADNEDRKEYVMRVAKLASEAEREACAKVCDAQSIEPECPERAQYCADAIRKRSNVNNITSKNDIREDKIEIAIGDALNIISKHLGAKDPEMLFDRVLAGLMKSKDYDDRATLGNNSIDWALSHYVAQRIGEASNDIERLHQFLVSKKASATEPYDFENIDRYGASFANEDDFKSMALMTQNYTYMVVLRRNTAYINNEMVPGWDVHIRRCTPGRYSHDYSRAEFFSLNAILSNNIIANKYDNNCDYFRYHDGRDRGYLCSVTRDIIGGGWKCEDVVASFKEFQGVFYDMMCHVSMLPKERKAKPAGRKP